MHQRHRKCCAFTIIEILVSIGVIGILLGILIPVLAGARDRAGEVNCLANLRSTSGAFALYAGAYDQAFPFIVKDGEEGALYTDPPPSKSSIQWDSPWKLVTYWPCMMHYVAPWQEFYETWLCPGLAETGKPWEKHQTSYFYCRAFQALPEAWGKDAEPDDIDSLLRGTHVPDVTYPSSKVLLFDFVMAHATYPGEEKPDARPMLFVDSHADIKKLSEATPPANNAFLDEWVGETKPLHDTPGGVRGRDY